MAHVISFTTARFDTSTEASNPINPIAGQSVLTWLRKELAKSGYQSTAPSTEDWGWYIDVQGWDATYLVGASADADGPGTEREWVVQVHKKRSFRDKLTGRNKMAADDLLFALIERIVTNDPQIAQVTVDKDG